MVMAFRFKTKHLRRCDKCQKTRHELYKVRIGPFSYNLCSSFCLDKAQKEYDEKKASGMINEEVWAS
jgi:hypothetical protein